MRSTLLFIAFCVSTLTTNAQTSVSLRINHLLNGEEMQFNKEAKNDLDNVFTISRLEYYLSGFTITHDGGQVTEVEDLYILLTQGQKSSSILIDLGTFDVSEIESVGFHYGVDEEANHADPALWPEDHPLAPKFPSMHWGWTAGYRFLALEGDSGPKLDQKIEFHCIGDEFYKNIELDVSVEKSDDVIIDINAECSNLLQGIDISKGLIIHGALGEITTLADNFVENVFTIANATSIKEEVDYSVRIYPNPTTNGDFTISAQNVPQSSTVKMYDALGRLLEVKPFNENLTLSFATSGIFIVNITDQSGNIISSDRVISY